MTAFRSIETFWEPTSTSVAKRTNLFNLKDACCTRSSMPEENIPINAVLQSSRQADDSAHNAHLNLRHAHGGIDCEFGWYA